MAERLVTPRENGVPYIILPSHELPLLDTEIAARTADWHHAEHPSNDPLLTSTIAGLAVRNSRVQWVNFSDHHADHNQRGYHYYYVGPDLPRTPEEQLTTVIMNSSLYIPSLGIDFSGRKPKEIEVTDEMRQYILGNNHIKVADLSSVRRFLQEYAMEQGFEHIAEGTIDKFLHASTNERREELAHFILAQLIEVSVDPVRQTYCQARKNGHIASIFPARPEHYVKRRVIRTPKHLNLFINKLQRRASQHYRVLHAEPEFEYLD